MALPRFTPYASRSEILDVFKVSAAAKVPVFVHLRSGLGKSPTVVELGEVSLGSPHYVSFACKDGKVSAVVDGVQVITNDEFQSTIASWEEGPLVLGTDAGGKRPWHGEVAALALFDQFVDKALSDANRQRFKQLHP